MEPERYHNSPVSNDEAEAEAAGLNSRALLCFENNRLDEALPLIRRMVEIFVECTVRNGHSHPKLQAVVNNYASALAASGKTPEEIHQTLIAVLAPAGISV